MTDDVINNVAICKPWAVEQFLVMLRGKIDRFLYENQRKKGFTSYGLDEIPPMSDKPEADQNVKSKADRAFLSYSVFKLYSMLNHP